MALPIRTLTVDPKPYRFRILSIANERTFNLSWFLACDSTGGAYAVHADHGRSLPGSEVAGIQNLTEVGMVPSVTTAGFPVWWPSDGRAGGVPDPKAMGPSWIQIGTEGGVLPALAVIPPSPITYEHNLRSVTVTNMKNHGLLLMSAERADAIVDFTPYAGKTLILYNDAPAPAPAHDDRYDYYTGDPDQHRTPAVRPPRWPALVPTPAPHAGEWSTLGCDDPGPALNMAALNAADPCGIQSYPAGSGGSRACLQRGLWQTLQGRLSGSAEHRAHVHAD